jgi:hypothetical protein
MNRRYRPLLPLLTLLSACTPSAGEDIGTPPDTSPPPNDIEGEDSGPGGSKDTHPEDTSAPPAPTYDCGDTGRYAPSPIGHWKVCIALELQDNDPSRSAQASALLEQDLERIEGLLDASIIQRLQDVQLWLERDVAAFPGGVYHPSAGWLSDNGYPEYWAEGVLLGNAANYLSWTSVQPAMVLHELTHAWHHQVLGFDQAEIQAAYDAAMASEIYEAVAYAGGGTLEAYATTNEIEYFAELTEAYFWENDFYPFSQSELATFDPLGHQAVENAWQPID